MKINNPITLEMWHKNESICMISMNTTGAADFNCHDFNNLKNKRKMPAPDIFSGMESIEQLCLDWISGNWYFLDDQKEIIFVCSPAMQHCTIVLESNLGKPRGMALDPTKGFIFYTKWGSSQASLDRAFLDGTNVKQLVTDKIVYPHGITVDLAMSHIYYVDTYLDNVERVNYDGTNRWSLKKKSQLLSIAQSLHSITVFEDIIYLASWKNQSIVAVNKFTSEARIIDHDVPRGISLHVYHRQKQPDVSHPCRENNGGCDHLCIPLYLNKNPTAKCLCSAGYRLNETRNCIIYEEPVFLMYAKESPTMIKGISILSEAKPFTSNDLVREVLVPVTNIGWPISFDYNTRDGLIYYSNTGLITRLTHTFTIESQSFDGKDRKILVENLKTVNGLAFDWMAYNLYYTNTDSNTVSVLKLDNSTVRKVIVKETYHPMAITLDPKRGQMYWCTWASLQQPTGLIETAWLDGSHRQVLVNATIRHLHWPTSLSIDFKEDKLYWCDPVTPGIERINLDGTGRQLLHEGTQNQFYPMSAVHYDGFIYWTDNVKGGIMKLSLEDALTDTSADSYVVLSEEKPLVYDMKIYLDGSRHDTNDCTKQYKDCPGLCLFTPEGTQCVCGDGHEMDSEKKICNQLANYTEVKTCPDGKIMQISNFNLII